MLPQTIIIDLLLYACITTGINCPPIPPKMEFVEGKVLTDIVKRDKIFIYAIYYYQNNTILINNKIKNEKETLKFIILHELVHFIQYKAKGKWKNFCELIEIEIEAYQVQVKYYNLYSKLLPKDFALIDYLFARQNCYEQ